MDIQFVVHDVGSFDAHTKGEVQGVPQGVKVNALEVQLRGPDEQHGAVQHGSATLRFWQPDEIAEALAIFVPDSIVTLSVKAPAAASAAPTPVVAEAPASAG